MLIEGLIGYCTNIENNAMISEAALGETNDENA